MDLHGEVIQETSQGRNVGSYMELLSYVIKRDFGFAPNPYFGYCTLATCKPMIRRYASIGDWLAAFGGSNTTVKGKLVMLMQIDETMDYDSYWQDIRFMKKIPTFYKGHNFAYGDNIYHHGADGNWVQESSHHSNEDGSINQNNLLHDTKSNRVLISEKFWYFGNNAIDIPIEYEELVHKGRGHKKCIDTEKINHFINWVSENWISSINGTPFSRQTGKFIHFKGER